MHMLTVAQLMLFKIDFVSVL